MDANGAKRSGTREGVELAEGSQWFSSGSAELLASQRDGGASPTRSPSPTRSRLGSLPSGKGPVSKPYSSFPLRQTMAVVGERSGGGDGGGVRFASFSHQDSAWSIGSSFDSEARGERGRALRGTIKKLFDGVGAGVARLTEDRGRPSAYNIRAAINLDQSAAGGLAQKLKITFVKATGLKSGIAPWCICEAKRLDRYAPMTSYVPLTSPKPRPTNCKSASSKNTSEPEWNDTAEIAQWLVGEALEFTVFDKAIIGSKSLGRAVIFCDQFYPNGFFGELPLDGSGGTLHVRIEIDADEAVVAKAGGGMGEVEILTTEAEWGGCQGLSSDSDDSSDDDRPARVGRRRRSSIARQPDADVRRKSAADGAKEGVDIVEVSAEWAGMAGVDSDSDSDSDVPGPKDKAAARRVHRMTLGAESIAAPDADVLQQDARRPSTSRRKQSNRVSARTSASAARRTIAATSRSGSCADIFDRYCKRLLIFVFCAVLYVCDLMLRLCCIFLYAIRSDQSSIIICVVLSAMQVCAWVLSTYITFHDPDIILTLHWLARSYPHLRHVAFCVVLVLFGFCQMIQVKRLWSRQVHTAEVLTDMDGKDEGRVEEHNQLRFAGAESIMPMALITGVPFLILQSTQECNQDSRDVILTAANLVLVLIVSIGVIETDLQVSKYVRERYHWDTNISGTRAGHFQFLYPFVHAVYRISEVMLRLIVLTGCGEFISRQFGQPLKLGFYLFELVVIVYLLMRHSPAKEHLRVHLVIGFMLLIVDGLHFVDQPNFTFPARRISTAVTVWRALMLILLLFAHCVQWTTVWYTGVGERITALNSLCMHLGWGNPLHLLCIVAVLHYALRLSPLISCRGDDLHTAASKGRRRRLKRLLIPEKTGPDQVLDVNAPTKDERTKTPLMLAAEGGHVKILEMLVSAGADVNHADPEGDTCLHHAARNNQIDVCRFLVSRGADVLKRNTKGEEAKDVVQKPRNKSDAEEIHYQAMLAALSENAKMDNSIRSCDPRSSNRSSLSIPCQKYYTVMAAPCAGMQLRSLFPDAADDDAPSPRVLQSVSALVLSRIAGPMTKRLLSPQADDRGDVPLGALRRVRELGKGGFGRVIEVELPADAAGTFWRRQFRPRRFALKLQLKQENNQAASEVQALRRADHPFIVRLERAFQTPRFFALLLELCPTDLNRLLCKSDEEGKYLGIDPPLAAKYLGQVLLALTHLHVKERIVYRDVKPENILISERDEAKLTDFGLAKVVTSAERMTMCGTIGFLPPEMYCAPGDEDSNDGDSQSSGRGRMDPYKTDAYSYGVTLQVTLLGEDGARKKTVRKKGPMMLPLHLNEHENNDLLKQLAETDRLSPEAYDLLYRLLRFDPSMRASLVEVLSDKWFKKMLGCEDMEEYLIGQARQHQFD